MLVAVIMFFVVLSFTGVAVLDISYTSKTSSMETVDNILMQYTIESTISESLWKINVGADSLVNMDIDGITVVWDSIEQVLTVDVADFGLESQVALDLSDDTHFERGIASNTDILTNGYTTGIEEENRVRVFNFLPDIDIDFFYDNKVKVHNGNDQSWKSEYLDTEGIHIFTGNNLLLDSISITNSTLVFTGKGITFTGTNSIKAPLPTGSSPALPALIFLSTDEDFTISAGDRVEGAIFCAGQLNIESAQLTGPIVGNVISLNDNIDLMDGDYSEYYRWTEGFGSQEDYDWPKQIGRWKTNTWGKATNS